MATLYLRNVPPELSERLARLAARAGMSVSAFAVRELDEVARRADNPALLADLPDLGVTAAEVLADLEAGRAGALIVLDASTAILTLLNAGDARRVLASEPVAVPHLMDSEVVHTCFAARSDGTP